MDDYIYVKYAGSGYAIFDKESLFLLEYSEIGNVYPNASAKNYYGGPQNYYFEENGCLVNVLSGNKAVFSDSEKNKMAINLREKVNLFSENKKFNYTGNLNLSTVINNANSIYDPEDPPIADEPDEDVKYIDNYEYFTNYLAIRGENIDGTCSSVATQILLTYNNYYNDRRLISNAYYMKGGWHGSVDSDIYNKENYNYPERNPNVCQDPTFKDEYTLGSSNNFYNHIISVIEPEMQGASIRDVRGGIQDIVEENLQNHEFSILRYSYSSNTEDILKNEINQGRPLLLSTGESVGGLNHNQVCYGYQNKGSEFGYIVDYGWGDGYRNRWISSLWCDDFITLTFNHIHNYSVSIGGYYQEVRCGVCGHRKSNFIYEEENNAVTILGLDGDLIGTILNIPSKINGKNVTSIGDGAFSLNSSIQGLGFVTPSYVTHIGDNAFVGCSSLAVANIPSEIESIGMFAFSNLDVEGTLFTYNGDGAVIIKEGCFSETKMLTPSSLPAPLTIGFGGFGNITSYSGFLINTQHLTSIGEKGFYKTDIEVINVSNNVINIGTNAFQNSNQMTIYTEYSSKPSGWASTWNSSNRPVIWGCTFDSDNTYVVSVNKTSSSISNASADNGINYPVCDGFDFAGWYTASDYSGTAYYNITEAPDGTLYAKWNAESSCVAEGTMVTLADGTEVAVENLSGNEQLLVWNMETGNFDSAPIAFVDSDSSAYRKIVHLYFEDGTELRIVDEHALWCFDLNEYVYLDENASEYIGKYFNKKTTNGYTQVRLVDVEIYEEIVRTYSPITEGHLCYYVNGLLSMPGGIGGLFNIYEVSPNAMKYDQESKQADELAYGLYTYEEFCEEIAEIPESAFVAFGGKDMKVAVGKGLITIEEILALIERYQVLFM